jgi:hypothetical protein
LQNYVVYNKLYNYFEPIPIPDPEDPKLNFRICTYAGGEEWKKTVQKNIILIILDTRLIWKSNLN